MKKTMISNLSTNLLWVLCKKNKEHFKFSHQSKPSDSNIGASSIKPTVNFPTIQPLITANGYCTSFNPNLLTF